jgi:GNAT superfamily N-acetyltransferase
MPAMLSNLLARAPTIDDLVAVSELLVACDIADYGLTDRTKEDILADWNRAGFNLDTDAWVIVTTDGRLVGYAHVWPCNAKQNTVFASVHPEYRNRGIGMLLLRLAEARAREQINMAPSTQRITLSTSTSHLNEAARHLLEREGYTPVRQFWRLIVETEDEPDESIETFSHRGKLKLDLPVDTVSPIGTTVIQKRTGIYVARQYDVYEKELRAGTELSRGEHVTQQCLAA